MNKIIFGDCRHTMRDLISQGVKVQMCVTSPPYFGLRDYGHPGQLGLEQTPDEYVANMVEVFSLVWELLADDGVIFVNLGDSYAGSGPSGASYRSKTTVARDGKNTDGAFRISKTLGERGLTYAEKKPIPPPGLKPKDLIGIPWRVAFALQAAGWYLRQDIIWHKPNPMPESVTDRCTKAHEYLFLLSKSERYYFDNEAIKEPAKADKGNAKSFRGGGSYTGGNSFINSATKERETHGNIPNDDGKRNRRSVWTIATTPYAGAHFATFPPALIEPCILSGSRTAGKRCDCDQLIESPTGSGAIEDPSAIVGRAGMSRPRRDGEGTRPITRLEQRHHAGEMKSSPHREEMAVICGTSFAHYIRTDTSGARPLPEPIRQDFMNRGWITDPAPCTCPSYPADVVFDPFMGSGTTAQVAIKLGRQYLGCELNPAYADLQNDRTAQDAFIF